MFLTTVKEVKLEVRPLFLPQLVQLTSMLKPGLRRITVRRHNVAEDCNKIQIAIAALFNNKK